MALHAFVSELTTVVFIATLRRFITARKEWAVTLSGIENKVRWGKCENAIKNLFICTDKNWQLNLRKNQFYLHLDNSHLAIY